MNLDRSELCLVVDDDSFSRRALKNILYKLGFNTIEAEDGLEAYSLFESRRPEIIFLDWKMPKMDGLEFLKRANKSDYRNEAKIIFLTGETSHEKIIEALDENPDEYLIKPFNKSKIESALHGLGI